VVTEAEIDNFIQGQQAQPGRDEFNVSHILVAVPENASPEQLRARRDRAEQALAQIRGGADFRQVAAAFSDGPEALQGGLIGWRQTDRLPTLFVDALRMLQPGQLSELLRSPNGFHILLLNERRGGAAPMLVQQTRARHILIKTNELVSETEARNRLLALKERLERRNQDVTQEGLRMNARQTLRERKTDEAYQEWVRQLRDRSYIEQRLESRN
jgi:peptidyl-prolyl cis-trans isomerase SurA